MSNPFSHPTKGPLHLGRSAVSPRSHSTMARAFAVHDFLSTLPAAPVELDLTSGRTDWGMMLNDEEGDCTCAACGHLIQTWTGVTLADSFIQTEYERACGYVPGNESTDQGGIISDVLDYFCTIGVGGYRISAHAEVNLTQMRIQQAMYVFNGLDLGIELPLSAQDQIGEGKVWDIVGDGLHGPASSGSWGGHSVAAIKYDATGVWCVTWGALQKMTWRFFMWYVDEAHACISPDAASPVPVTQLVADLQQART